MPREYLRPDMGSMSQDRNRADGVIDFAEVIRALREEEKATHPFA
jgi:hypothetical protein